VGSNPAQGMESVVGTENFTWEVLFGNFHLQGPAISVVLNLQDGPKVFDQFYNSITNYKFAWKKCGTNFI
jgi:hypothetical protein